MELARATEILPCGTWPAEALVDHIALTFDDRHRRRKRYTAQGGTTFLLDLKRSSVLGAGDALRLTDGRLIRVDAAQEALLEVTAPDARTLLRLAWHIGNRHVPARLEVDRILIREDGVMAAMLRGLGASVLAIHAPFTPEPGAYDAQATAGAAHGHEHPHRHEHPHGHEHPHAHEHDHEVAHVRFPDPAPRARVPHVDEGEP
jgi:urease accessory protein